MVIGTPAHGDCLDGPYPIEVPSLEELMPDYNVVEPAEEVGESVVPTTNSDRAILALAPLVDAYLYLKARGCDHPAAMHFLQLITASPDLIGRVYRE